MLYWIHPVADLSEQICVLYVNRGVCAVENDFFAFLSEARNCNVLFPSARSHFDKNIGTIYIGKQRTGPIFGVFFCAAKTVFYFSPAIAVVIRIFL